MFDYKLVAQDGQARVGEFTTPHGTVTTPMFMPVGTHGAVKSVSSQELKQIGSQMVLANTYHLYLRPGDELIAVAGGLHTFLGYDGPMLTDSGGFQVFSLGERGMAGNQKTALRSVSEEGITFRSHLDGSKHLFTPERSLQIQKNLGADVIMAFDQPVYGLTDEGEAGEAMRRSMRWLERSKAEWQQSDTQKQALFGIVQGGTHTVLHQESARYVADLDLPGNAIGGLSVGEGKEQMWQAVESITNLLPVQKPCYFMGLGEPRDLIDATLRGVDMYDCVAPSRLARHGALWQVIGDKEATEAFYSGDTARFLALNKLLHFERWNLHNARFEKEFMPLSGPDLGGGLEKLSLATLRHYIKEHEMLGFRMLTLHNIAFLHLITRHMRVAIQRGELGKFAELLE